MEKHIVVACEKYKCIQFVFYQYKLNINLSMELTIAFSEALLYAYTKACSFLKGTLRKRFIGLAVGWELTTRLASQLDRLKLFSSTLFPIGL